VPEPSAFVTEIVIEKLKRHETPSIDQIPVELIKAGGRIIRYEIRQLMNSIWNKEELPEGWKEWIIGSIYKKSDKQIVVIIELWPTMYAVLSKILCQG
jgi:hypothetical protein